MIRCWRRWLVRCAANVTVERAPPPADDSTPVPPEELAWVVQYNKRDLPNSAPLEEMQKLLNPKGLPEFEALLSSGRAHPYTLYLSLCAILGNLSALGSGLVPPVLAPYSHDDLYANFDETRNYIFRVIDEGILESHTAIPFDFENGIFSLRLIRAWTTPTIVIGVRGRTGGLDRQRLFKLQGPERQIDPVAPKITHRPVSEIPPSVPLGAGKVDFIKWPFWRRAQP